MRRKRITQIFPWLIPIRRRQRLLCFYAGMRLDGRTYAKTLQDKALPYELFSADSGLYNTDTGFDMIYQENKVYNLKLAVKQLNGLLIKPGETFSLWKAIRHADRHTRYREGLTVTNGKLGTATGGGLCQISNLLFWMFLHSPLTIVERHTHRVKDFPTMRNTEPEGVDATVSEGWLDLRVENQTNITFQIRLSFDDMNIFGHLSANHPAPVTYKIEGKNLTYVRVNGMVYQKVSIYRREMEAVTQEAISEKILYANLCKIGYPLPEGTEICES